MSRPLRWPIAAAVGIATVLAVGYGVNLPLQVAPSDEQRAVETAFRNAITAESQVQTAGTLPPHQPFLPSGLPGQHETDRALLSASMTGPALAIALAAADQDRVGRSVPSHSLWWVDAGVERMHFYKISVANNWHATLVADAEVWFNYYGRGNPPGGAGSAGHNGINYRADLVRSGDGRWRLHHYDWRFIQGEGP